MKKEKVIGFGIGTSCKDYLKHYRDEYEIIALSDWSSSNHGTIKYGFNVISPYEFEKYDFDKILILSFYVNEIKQQLFDNLGIKEDRLIVPPKHKIKGVLLPFEDETTKELARDCLVYFSHLMEKNNIKGFLDYGALLGIIRDGDIITWDDDIDFSIMHYDSSKLEKLLIREKDNFPKSDILKWTCKINKDDAGNNWYFSLNFENLAEPVYREFEIAFTVRKFYKGHAIKMRNDYQSAPEVYFKNSEYIIFQDEKILAPFKPLEYLDFYYKNWRQPEKLTFGVKYGISYHGNLDEIKVRTEVVDVF